MSMKILDYGMVFWFWDRMVVVKILREDRFFFWFKGEDGVVSFVWTGEEGPPLAIAAAMSICRQWSHPSFLSYFFSLLAATKIIYFLGHNERDFFFLGTSRRDGF